MTTIRAIKNSRGFTLIELMITVAIVGILTAVALPAYQDYTVRSQVSEGLSLVSGAKPVVGEYFANHGNYPTNDNVGFTGYIGKFITKTEIGADGKIIATFGNQANSKIAGQTVTLSPEADVNTGNIKWTCGSSANAKYLPTSCANDSSTGNPGNPGGGTDPTNPGGENETPNSPQVYNIDTNYTFFSYQDGKMINNYDGGELTLLNTTEDGTQIFGNAINYNNSIFELLSNGTMSQITLDKKVQTFYPSQDGGGYITYAVVNGESIIIPGGQTGPYAGSTFSTYTNYANTTSRYKNGAASKAEYDTALSNFKNQLREVATNNGGSFPTGFPTAFIELLNF